MGLRSRVILVNTDLVRDRETPRTLTELLTGPSAASAGMALPLFGTSFTHAAVLFSRRGSGWTEALYQNAVAAGVRILDGNARVAALVAEGTLSAGLTDTDDARAVMDRGAPVRIVVPEDLDDGGLSIPGTVSLVAGAPHPATARRLVDFLLSSDVEDRLIDDGYFDRSVRTPPPGTLPDWNAVARDLEGVRERLREIFLR